MQAKYETYEQLCDETLQRLTSDKSNWLGFLGTASRMYKYSFEEQVQIFAQKPETRACANFDFWTSPNRMNRHIRKGSQSIRLIDRQRRNLYYLYAMEDTEARANGKSKNPEAFIWKLQPEQIETINQNLCKKGGIHSDSLEKTIFTMAVSSLKTHNYLEEFQEIYNRGNYKMPYDELSAVFNDTLRKSSAIMAMNRCGIDSAIFENNLKSSAFEIIPPEFSALLGKATSDTAGIVIKTIERAVLEQQKLERSKNYVEKLQGRTVTEAHRGERNPLRSGRENTDLSSRLSRGGTGERTDRQMGQDEGAISQGAFRSDLQQNVVDKQADGTSSLNRQTGLGDGGKNSSGTGRERGNGRGTESDRPVGMGRTDEQLQNDSKGNNNQGTDRSILSKEAEETNTSALLLFDKEVIFVPDEEAIHDAFSEINLNHSFSEKQKLFLNRLEKYAVKNNITENIIDSAFSKRLIYRRTYGSRGGLDRVIFENTLNAVEKELETAIQKNLNSLVEKSADSSQQEKTEPIIVHSEKTEGQETEDIISPEKAEVFVGDVIEVDGKNWIVDKVDGDFSIFLTNQDKTDNQANMTQIGNWKGMLDYKVVKRASDEIIESDISKSENSHQLSFFDSPKETVQTELAEMSFAEQNNLDLSPDTKEKLTDFTITDDALGEGGAKSKYRANVNAIKTLKAIESENRNATPEEQQSLSKYVGWGGLKNAFEDFHDDWKNEFNELKELLTEDEYRLAQGSVLNSHYTSPVVIEKIYEALSRNGFEGGKILEPAMGVGNFFGKMPENMRSNSKLYGVELDDISGRIAKQLYPNAKIRITGFEKNAIKDNYFDLAVGNVPFGAYSLNEAKYNKYNFQIHDHFFAKALDKVKSGGIVAFITSKGTLDKKNNSVRKYIAERAELVGAIRLPNNAFKNNAGTEVTSDIIFLKKRESPIELTPLTTPDWVNLGVTEDNLAVNQYFIDNPDMVLGKIVSGNKLYGHGNDDTSCVAIEGAVLSEQLSNAIKNINFEVAQTIQDENEVEERNVGIPLGAKNFSYVVIDDKIYYRNNYNMELFKGKKSDTPRIKAMVKIRDCLREIIDLQVNNCTDGQLKEVQEKLNNLYDSFVEKYGRINDKVNSSAFKEDSSAPLLSSLEKFKGDEFVGKAPIFEKRTILAKRDVTSADTSSEALTLSLSKKACVDIKYMQELTGFTKDKILSDLHGIVFENPMKMDSAGNPVLEASDEYLSGNIRKKLEFMKENYADDSRYAYNISALETAMPPWIQAGDIDIKLGSPCISPELVQQFMYESFNTPHYKQYSEYNRKNCVSVQYADITSLWCITNKAFEKGNTGANAKFGTQRCSAYELLEDCLNLKSTVVKDAVDVDGKTNYILNQDETEFAQEKQKQIQQSFKEWIFSNETRREEVVENYNRMFNSVRPREYDGSALEFVGMNSEITLRKHQKDAIARALYGGNTLFAHEVGAGKTYEMIASAMEGKRLGLHQKAMICVPNHLTEQIGSDFIELYPNANILVATADDFKKNNRKKLFAKIATGDYDAVIIGHSQLTKIPISNKRQEELLQREIDEIVLAIAEMKIQSGENFQIKQLETTKKKLENKLSQLLNAPRRDDLVEFEELGIDKLIIDEAHMFKNLFIATKMRNVSGLSTNNDVQKTFDLYLKCQYLDEITGGKGIIMATGTPVSNSISEIFTMMKYLQSDLLKESKLNHFDMWAANFAETVTESQLAPEGNGYQMKTRFAKFNNLPELMALFKECADIKTTDQLGLKIPECTMHTVVAQPSNMQKEMIESLSERAKRIRLRQVDRKADNMPMITNDGRKIGLDQRLMNPDLPDYKDSKLNMCIDNVYDIWNKTSDERLTQVVFCDLGVPQSNADKKKKGEKFSVYDDIKQKLIEKGVPSEEVAFIHDATTEEAKDKLFSKVRKGDIRVLIGSTQKMGAGTNIQTKLVALHDLDAPWKPSDMEQRRGRMVRQGNENSHVDLYRYVTEGTFDAYLYQILENKQKFISQIMTSNSPVRSCEDLDEVTLSYAEVKALSAGNPLIKEKMDLDIEVSKLKTLKSAHENNIYTLQREVSSNLPAKIQFLKNEIEYNQADIEKRNASPITYDKDGKSIFPSIEIKGKMYTDKEEAGKALIEAMTKAVEVSLSKPQDIGNYRGFKLSVGYDMLNKSYKAILCGETKHMTEIGKSETGNFTRLDNVLGSMEKKISSAQQNLNALSVQLEEAKKQLNVPFPREEELREKSERLAELTKLLEISADDKPKTTTVNEITDPYFLGECTSDVVKTLKDNNITLETADVEGKTLVKIDRKDKDKVHELLSVKPKLTL